MNFDQLNANCKWLIFRLLPLQERLQLRLVCRDWRQAIEANCHRQGVLRLFDSRTALKRYYSQLIDQSIQDQDHLAADTSNTIILSCEASQAEAAGPFLGSLFSSINNLVISTTSDVALSAQLLAKLLTRLAPTLETLMLDLRTAEDLYAGHAHIGHSNRQLQRQLWPALHQLTTLKRLYLQLDRLDGHLVPRRIPALLRGLTSLAVDIRGGTKTRLLASLAAPPLKAFRLTDFYYSLRDLGPNKRVRVPKTVTHLAVYLPTLASGFGDVFSQTDSVTHLDLAHDRMFFALTLIELIEELSKFSRLVSLRVNLAPLLATHRLHPIPEQVLDSLPDLPLRTIRHLHLIDYSTLLATSSIHGADSTAYFAGLFKAFAGTFPNVRRLTFSSEYLHAPEAFLDVVDGPAKQFFGDDVQLVANQLSSFRTLMGQFPKRGSGANKDDGRDGLGCQGRELIKIKARRRVTVPSE